MRAKLALQMLFLSPRGLSNAIKLKEAEVKNNIEH
ncbi:hypothetical protein SAMN05428947_10345 [Mucilaginibacter sp. OK283]|jgi:hypothetical protein|nr:hypothetical protein SAMN05428947_10345 [Mucilaginibacter sp. OK283]